LLCCPCTSLAGVRRRFALYLTSSSNNAEYGKHQLKDVTVAYGDKKVLDGINLSIYRGESVALIGPSGKCSTLNVCDVLRVDSGRFPKYITNSGLHLLMKFSRQAPASRQC
jgi:ABC-type transport system involved in cytochrome bd biosynthesis fused ATPase/permease subunit